jgi:hypothetical protein
VPLCLKAADNLSAAHVDRILILGPIVGVSGVMSSVNFTQKTGRYYLLTLGLYVFFPLSVGAPIMSTLRVRGRVALLEIGLVADSFTSSVGVNCALIVLSIVSQSISPFKTSR